MMFERSTIPKYLLNAAASIEEREGGNAWEADACRMAADRICELEAMVFGPRVPEIEEGDCANGQA